MGFVILMGAIYLIVVKSVSFKGVENRLCFGNEIVYEVWTVTGFFLLDVAGVFKHQCIKLQMS